MRIVQAPFPGSSIDRMVRYWYASGMTSTKRKVSVSLDADLVAELERADEALSTQVNDAIRTQLEQRRRQRELGELLDELEAIDGKLEQALVDKYLEILG